MPTDRNVGLCREFRTDCGHPKLSGLLSTCPARRIVRVSASIVDESVCQVQVGLYPIEKGRPAAQYLWKG